MNLSGIVGPALGGLLLPLLGAPLLISINALTFVIVALVVLQWKPRPMHSSRLRENFAESFINSLRYALHSPSMHTILFRNLLFSLVISVVPALLPVIALKELHFSAAQLGFVFTSVGVGSLAGATIGLPYLRPRMSPNAITSIALTIMTVVLFAMVFLRQVPALMVCAALAGVAWALAGSEIWLAGQRVMPEWVRGRMNAFQIMLGQGGIALGALLLGTGVAHAGLDLTLAAAAILALTGLILGHRFSINFATEASVDSAPLNTAHDFPVFPEHQDGPITVAIEYSIASGDRERFRTLMEEVQAACRRNGAFQCRLDESLDQPGLFRLDYMVSTWAEYLRQKKRMTVDETQAFNKAWELHAANSEPVIRHFLSSQSSMQLHSFGFSGRTFADTGRDRNW